MGIRIEEPDDKRIELSDGDWIIVKKRLSAGEARRMMGRMVKDMRAGEGVQLDPEQVGRSKIVEYLIDWSNTRAPIRGKKPDAIAAALDSLNLESFNEILQAVDAHEEAMQAEREKEKNGTAGETASSAISASPA